MTYSKFISCKTISDIPPLEGHIVSIKASRYNQGCYITFDNDIEVYLEQNTSEEILRTIKKNKSVK